MSRAVMEQSHIILIPVYLQELAAKVFRAKAKIEHNSDKNALPEQIASETNIPLDAVVTILKGNDMSFRSSFSPGETTPNRISISRPTLTPRDRNII